MSKVFMNKRKTVTSIIAVALTAVIIFGGTFAWQSISQEALNEVAATRNPGGRLHDDFVDITYDSQGNKKYDTMTFNKDVYVENFTSYADNGVQVFARVRLDEYMELGENAGVAENTTAKSVVDGATLDNKDSWTTHVPGKDSVFNDKDPFHEYWNWDIITDKAAADDGIVDYLPTYNKNKDSLEADINGTFDKEFSDYTKYTEGQVITGKYEIVDNDDNDVDELDNDHVDLNAVIEGTQVLGENYNQHVTVEKKDHTVEKSLSAYVITMAQWEALPDAEKTGDFWVWDEDGWAYWANPINPETATGVLLNGISRKENVINEDWYYAINVVAQFITKDDIGIENNNGFYDLTEGKAPSDKALLLLNEIGVDVTFEVDNAEELKEALAHGGNVILNSDVTIDTNLVVSADTTLDLNGHTISNTDNIYNVDNKVWSLISVQGADTTLTINGGNFTAKENDCFAVDVRDGAKVIINDGNFVGNISAVYVHSGSALINGGTFSIKQPNTTAGEGAHDQMINAYDENYANGTADITICGGTFYGFNPTAANDAELVPIGYSVSDTDGVYTVSKTEAE